MESDAHLAKIPTALQDNGMPPAALRLLAVFLPSLAWLAAAAPPVECGGKYPRHLQGVCRAPSGDLYWSWTNAIARTDAEGNLLVRVEADNHQGDLCYHDGRVYVAVNLGKFNRPAGEADSWVYVFDAETLELLEKHAVPELVHGAGGMACDGERFIVVGGLPEGIEENYLYEYDLELRFVRRHVLPSGYTRLGIQTAAWAHGAWWFGCYGRTLLRTDENFELDGAWTFDAALGLEEAPDGRFLVGRNRKKEDEGYTGWVVLAKADEETGLRLVE